ncbi:MAG: hypothetical protein AAF614_30730 [Chloroflexota bacterium]
MGWHDGENGRFPNFVQIEHPSGVIDVTLDRDNGNFEVISGGILRMARRLFAGKVYVPAEGM